MKQVTILLMKVKMLPIAFNVKNKNIKCFRNLTNSLLVSLFPPRPRQPPTLWENNKKALFFHQVSFTKILNVLIMIFF